MKAKREDRREELYRTLSICVMVRDSLDKTKDDSERGMEQFEAANTVLEMLRKFGKASIG